MPLTHLPISFGFVVALTAFVACGGAAESNYGSQVSTSGGALGVGGAISQGGGTSTEEVCCNSRPHCNDGELELGSGASCPADSDCYRVDAVCCSPAIYCARSKGTTNTGGTGPGGNSFGGNSSGGNSPGGNSSGGALQGGASMGGSASGGSGATGNANLGGWSWGTLNSNMVAVGGACSAPACASGYVPVNATNCMIPAPIACYTMTSCGSTFGCQKSGTTCDRAAEYERKYQFADTSVCQANTISCPANTTAFKDACGCGCEQPAKCPQWIDCMPGPSTLSALCSDAALCPFTLRAL